MRFEALQAFYVCVSDAVTVGWRGEVRSAAPARRVAAMRFADGVTGSWAAVCTARGTLSSEGWRSIASAVCRVRCRSRGRAAVRACVACGVCRRKRSSQAGGAGGAEAATRQPSRESEPGRAPRPRRSGSGLVPLCSVARRRATLRAPLAGAQSQRGPRGRRTARRAGAAGPRGHRTITARSLGHGDGHRTRPPRTARAGARGGAGGATATRHGARGGGATHARARCSRDSHQ